MHWVGRVSLVFAVILLLSSPAVAATYYVPDDFTTIQAALDGAVNGDTIIVRDGTYTGAGNKNLDFSGKALTLQSENGPETCIIDCEGSGRGFYFRSIESLDSVLDGFTIQNGMPGGDDAGGAIRCDSASPTIRNCIMTANSAPLGGGGIYCNEASSPNIENCVIRNNSGSMGGGIRCYWNSSPLITGSQVIANSAGNGGGLYTASDSTGGLIISNCVIQNNSADQGGGGLFSERADITVTDSLIKGNTAATAGGIYFFETSSFISGCTIEGNIANLRDGGGIVSAYSTPTLEKCIIKDNSAWWDGGGIRCTDLAAPIMKSCTFTGNSAVNGAGISLFATSSISISFCTFFGNAAMLKGGAIHCAANSSAMIVNSIFWQDSAETGGAELALAVAAFPNFLPSSVDISYSDVQGGQAAVSSDPDCTVTWGTGNLDEDPLFLVIGDYHLSLDSPCIDAGTDAGIYEDIDGDIRPQNSGFDIGADEVLPCEYFIEPDWFLFDSVGGAGSISVSTGANCYWTAVSNSDWIVITSGIEGIGSGTIHYSVLPITTTVPRGGRITIGEFEFMVIQAGLAHAVGLDITPISTIVSQGGKLRYTVAATNLTDSPIAFQCWTTVNLPNGSMYPESGALFGPVSVTLAAFESRSPIKLTQSIPWTAPAGTYTYNAYIGTYPSTVINEDHFNFTVR